MEVVKDMAPNRKKGMYYFNCYIPGSIKKEVDILRRNNDLGIKLKFKEVLLENMNKFMEAHKEKVSPLKGYDIKSEHNKFIGPDTSEKFHNKVMEYLDGQKNLNLRSLVILSLLQYINGGK
jgi:hypothetical protein